MVYELQMNYKIVLSSKANKQFAKIPKEGRRIDNLYPIRLGDYRIVYLITDKELLVLILSLGHQKEIYRNL